MEDMHEATFVWPEIDPQDVILTGTFDQWSSSIRLTKTPRGFEGKVKLPWNARVLYKFIVDGRWSTVESLPEEIDLWGNVNNVYECPSKPVAPKLEKPLADLPPEFAEEQEHNVAPEASMLASPAATTMEQLTPPETTSQLHQQVMEPDALSAHKELSEATGSLPNQARVNGVAPIIEDNQEEAESTNEVDQVTQHTPAATIAAQPTSNAEMPDITKAQGDGIPEVTSVEPATKEAAVEDTPKEQTNGNSGTERALGSSTLVFVASDLSTAIHALTGVDPLHVDQIPVASPTPTQDTCVVDSQQHPESAAPPVSPPELDVESGSKSVIAVDAVAESKGEESAVAVPKSNDVASADADAESRVPESSATATIMTVVTSSSGEPEPTPAPHAEPEVTPAPPAEPEPMPAPATKPEATPAPPELTPAPPELTPAPSIGPDPAPAPPVPAPPAEPDTAPAPPAEPDPTPAPATKPDATPAPPELTPAPSTEPDPAPAPPVEPEPTSVPTIEPDPTPAPPAEQQPTRVPTAELEPMPAPPAEPEPMPVPTTEPEPTSAPPTFPEVTTAPVREPEPASVPPATPSSQLAERSPPSVPAVQAADPVLSSKTDKPANGPPPSEAGESMKSHLFPTNDTKATASTTGNSSQSSSMRKKRFSIFGKIKDMFHSDKGEKKERK